MVAYQNEDVEEVLEEGEVLMQEVSLHYISTIIIDDICIKDAIISNSTNIITFNYQAHFLIDIGVTIP